MDIILQITDKTPDTLKLLPKQLLDQYFPHLEKGRLIFDNVPATFREDVMLFKKLNYLRLCSLRCNCCSRLT